MSARERNDQALLSMARAVLLALGRGTTPWSGAGTWRPAGSIVDAVGAAQQRARWRALHQLCVAGLVERSDDVLAGLRKGLYRLSHALTEDRWLVLVEDALALARALWSDPHDEDAPVLPLRVSAEPEPAPESDAMVEAMTALSARLGQFLDVLERVDARLTALEAKEAPVLDLAPLYAMVDEIVERDAKIAHGIRERDKEINATLGLMVRAIKTLYAEAVLSQRVPNVGMLSILSPGGRVGRDR